MSDDVPGRPDLFTGGASNDQSHHQRAIERLRRLGGGLNADNYQHVADREARLRGINPEAVLRDAESDADDTTGWQEWLADNPDEYEDER